MILAYDELKLLVATGVIGPVDPDDINGSSIDVRLGAKVLYEACVTTHRDPHPMELRLGERAAICTGTADITHQTFPLKPGRFCLAHTQETFNLPLNISAEFRLKSSVARMGMSHALAVWCDPGWTGSQLTLELYNISQWHTILMRKGDKIGQMIFHRHAPVPPQLSYAKRGAYNYDIGPSAAKPEVK